MKEALHKLFSNPQSLNKDEVIQILVYVVLFVFVGAIIKLLLDIHYSRKSVNWTFTEGVIVKMRRVKEISKENNYMFDCKYTYEVDGIEYKSKRIKYGTFTLATISNKELERLFIQYPIGTKIKVYYDVSNPKRSVIEPGFSFDLLLLLLGCLLMCGFCLYRILTGNYN